MGVAVAVMITIWTALLESVVSQYLVQEVNVGNTAVLPCPSNDDYHRFQYWELEGNQVIGPENKINPTKYKYEVLSGKLYIKTVELIVKKDWEEVWENDTETNIYRGVIAVLVLVVLAGLAFLAYRIVKRRRSARFRDMSDEESPDEGPARGGTYNVSNLPPMSNAVSPTQGVDNPALDTDFPKVFNTIQTSGASQM
ncbi:hypothetical protein C0J52_11304 [Blattella germanica]|nr:hypothetical protein C0J52_11304 [Blattella germanica]